MFVSRTYTDFRTSHSNKLDFVEMDTVKSARGSNKCILTFYFPKTELFPAHLLFRCTPGTVRAVFDCLQTKLGRSFDFFCLFLVILTDRGAEFGNPYALEMASDGTARTSIYYCDPMRSNLKGGIENVHTMLRMILPKGAVFDTLTQ